MIKFLLFIFFSAIEVVSTVILMFVVFRMNYFLKFIPHIVFIGLACSYVSYNLWQSDLGGISPIIQCAVFFILVWLLFRIQVFYALFISTISYMAYGLIQGILTFGFHFMGWLKIEDIGPNTPLAFAMQTLTALITLILSFILHKLNWGFNFVPHYEFAPINMKNDNSLILFIVILSILVIGLTYYFTIKNNLNVAFNFLVLCNIIVVLFLLILARRKDREEND